MSGLKISKERAIVGLGLFVVRGTRPDGLLSGVSFFAAHLRVLATLDLLPWSHDALPLNSSAACPC